MKLDRQYIERDEALERDIQAGIGLFGYIGQQAMPEGEDFAAFLTSKGVPFQERSVSTVGTWEDWARELHYQRPEHGERYAYLLNSRPAIDAMSQNVYIFGQRVPDDHLAQTIFLIQQQERELDQLVHERRKELDQAYPPGWRVINYNWPLSIIAYHLAMYGWTPRIERELKQWGAYAPKDGEALENDFVQSLLQYGRQYILAQPDPYGYLQELLGTLGKAGRRYQRLLEA